MRTHARTPCAMAVGILSLLLASYSIADIGDAPMSTRTPITSRSDAFFGIHFDLHANPGDTNLGGDVTEEMIHRFLNKVRPDVVQWDCKGHGGYTSYPTEVGMSAPHITKDALAIWRKVTREHGVLLFVHYSGLFDHWVVQEHPDWARVDAEGKPSTDIASIYGPYADELMIPQLIEIAEKYDVDGAWIDGDGWAAAPDYSPAAQRAFTEATGIDQMPKKSGDPHWRELLEVQRQDYRDYARKYTDAIHAAAPGFEITSVAFYGPLSPERPTLPFDYISGDYQSNDSQNRARMDARIFTSAGLPWDLMAWGFNAGEGTGHAHKSAAQLQQEAAIIMAQGGTFLTFYQPTRAGYIDEKMFSVMSEVGDFCRARKNVSFKTETVPQVALMLPAEWMYKTWDNLFGGWSRLIDPSDGVLYALLERHYSVDVMSEWRLLERLDEYPIVVVPDCGYISDDVRDALLAYVDRGGKLILTGPETVQPFEEALGVEFEGAPTETTAYIPGQNLLGWLSGPWQKVRPVAGSSSIARRYTGFDTRGGGECAATVNNYGAGRIVGIYGPFGSAYFHAHSPALRQRLGTVMQNLFPEPLVDYNGPPNVDIAIRRGEDGLLVHLMNLNGMQNAPRYPSIDQIPAVGPIQLLVRLDEKPEHVSLVPSELPIRSEWTDEGLRVTIPALHIHEVLVIH